MTRYANDPANAATLSHNVAQALHVDDRGSVWIGTLDGLNRFEEDTESFTVFRSPDNPIVNGVSVIETRERGGLWIGTFGAGLYSFDTMSGVFQPAPLEGEFGASIIVSLFEDQDGTLWIGTGGDGLHELDAGGAQKALPI